VTSSNRPRSRIEEGLTSGRNKIGGMGLHDLLGWPGVSGDKLIGETEVRESWRVGWKDQKGSQCGWGVPIRPWAGCYSLYGNGYDGGATWLKKGVCNPEMKVSEMLPSWET